MRLKVIGHLLLAAAIFLGGSLISAQGQKTLELGFVRFAHTAVDVGAIDIYLGRESQTPLVKGLAYGEYTKLYTLPTTTKPYIVRAAGSSPTSGPLFELSSGVKPNYTDLIIAAGLSVRKAFILEPINTIRSKFRDRARIRIINMVWGGPALKVTSDAYGALSTGLNYIGISDQDVDPGKATLEVTTGSGQSLATVKDIEFKANKHYAVIIHGGANGKPPTQLMIIETDQEITRVKFVNESSIALDIFVKGNNKTVVANQGKGEQSSFIEFPSGSYSFLAKMPGQGLNSRDLAGIALQLYPGRDVTIVIKGDAALKMEVAAEVMTPENSASE